MKLRAIFSRQVRFLGLAASVAKAKTPEDYTARYVRFALANRALYVLTTSRPHATMKHNPPLQTAVHKVITEAMRIFARDIEAPAERRRAVMKVYITRGARTSALPRNRPVPSGAKR